MFDNNPITKLLKDQEDEIKQSNPSLLSTPEQSPTKLMEKFDETQNPIYKEAAKSNYKGLMSKFGMGAVGIAAMATPTGRREIVEHAAPIVGKAIKEAAPLMFQGFKDISSTVLEKLTGRSTVSKQFIEDTLKQAGVRAADADMVRKELAVYGADKIDVTDFAQRVKDNQILPIEIGSQRSGRDNAAFEYVNLPEEQRGGVADYHENIYTSPVKNRAGNKHGFDEVDNYFAHTRTENLGDAMKGLSPIGGYYPNGTRRVLEIQSDLFQKGGLEKEASISRKSRILNEKGEEGLRKELENLGFSGSELEDSVKQAHTELKRSKQRLDEVAKLKPYENTWYERIAREEVKRAALDNMTKLQFPTGETAMKIEGLGENVNQWVSGHGGEGLHPTRIDDLTVGKMLERAGGGAGDKWVVTDVVSEGKFRAVPEKVQKAIDAWSILEDTTTGGDKVWLAKNSQTGEVVSGSTKEYAQRIIDVQKENALKSSVEQFDISGRIDKDNPIYKFYESELAKFLKNKFNAKQVVDDKGVSWYEVDVKPYKDQPVLAHGAVPANILATGAAATAGIASIFAGLDKAAEKNKETYIKKEVTPSEKQAIEKERKEKEFLSLVDKTTKAIAETETGGVKTDRYLFARDSGNKELGQALGKYQITEGELQTYEKRFLEADVTPHEFLTSPELQDTYMKNKVAYYLKQGYTPTEVYDIHYNGIRKAGEPGSGMLQDPEIAGRFHKLFTQAK